MHAQVHFHIFRQAWKCSCVCTMVVHCLLGVNHDTNDTKNMTHTPPTERKPELMIDQNHSKYVAKI